MIRRPPVPSLFFDFMSFLNVTYPRHAFQQFRIFTSLPNPFAKALLELKARLNIPDLYTSVSFPPFSKRCLFPLSTSLPSSSLCLFPSFMSPFFLPGRPRHPPQPVFLGPPPTISQLFLQVTWAYHVTGPNFDLPRNVTPRPAYEVLVFFKPFRTVLASPPPIPAASLPALQPNGFLRPMSPQIRPRPTHTVRSLSFSSLLQV